MVHSLCVYSLHICNPIYSFANSLIMKNYTTIRIRLIKFAIGILIGVTIYLIVRLIF